VQAPRKILIVRLGALGDVVHVLPALDALRAALPGAELHWAVETACASLVKALPALAGAHVLPRKEWAAGLASPASWLSIGKSAARAVRALRRERFDLALDFQGNLRSGVVSYLSSAASRLGFAKGADKEGSHLFYTEAVSPPAGRLHKAEKNLALLVPLGIRAPLAAPRLPDPLPGGDAARDALTGLRRPILAFHPGVSAFGALKAYPPALLARAAREAAERAGGTVLFTFGPGEWAAAEALAREAGPSARPAPETRSLPELAAVFRAADAVCGADTGPVQLAAAAGAAVVALFGPKDPAVYRPLGDRVSVLTASDPALPCVPCNGRRCRIAREDGFSPCMAAIPPSEVSAAVLRALGRA
jgi:ADP-heptose:LPS heptosyltransferase